MDFRKGDKVFDTNYGNGVVSEINRTMRKNHFSVVVDFENGVYTGFTEDGKLNLGFKYRSLYHGHDLEFSIKEKIPIRKKKVWVNIYWNKTSNKLELGIEWDTKEEAIETRVGGCLKTIELEIDDE